MMARPIFEQTVRTLMKRRPFYAFVIEMDDGQRWVVEKPERLTSLTHDSVLYNGDNGLFDFVDCDNVRQITELATQPTS